jgi:hypothetical protein
MRSRRPPCVAARRTRYFGVVFLPLNQPNPNEEGCSRGNESPFLQDRDLPPAAATSVALRREVLLRIAFRSPLSCHLMHLHRQEHPMDESGAPRSTPIRPPWSLSSLWTAGHGKRGQAGVRLVAPPCVVRVKLALPPLLQGFNWESWKHQSRAAGGTT